MATTDTTRGFRVPCLRCSEYGRVSIDLDNVTVFRCDSCNEEWDADDVKAVLDSWGPVLAWIETAPALTDDRSTAGGD